MLHRRPLDWSAHKHIFAEIHTFKQTHITTAQCKNRQDEANEAMLVNKVEARIV